MYIARIIDNRSKKPYLVIRESFRNAKGKPTSRNVKKYGYINEGNEKALYEKAKNDLDILNSNIEKQTNIIVNFREQNSTSQPIKNLGYCILEQIYKALNIDTFISKNTPNNIKSYNVSDALKLLIYSRILWPGSKNEAYKKQKLFFNAFDIDLINVYRSLDYLNLISQSLQLHLHKELSKLYKRNLTLTFYDITNYFFETEIEDDLRAKDVSKENRESPIVQMGLLMDQQGIPIAYKLFRGDTLDQLTLIDTIEEFQKIFNVHSITLVADKCLNSGRNLQYLINHKHKYIVSQMVRTNDEKFREKILDQNGYKWLSGQHNFKLKEFDWQREYTDKETQEKHQIKYRVIAYWSQAFADRERFKRDRKNDVDWDKYQHDIEMDGYYAIITSDYDSTPIEIIQKYKELRKIEEIFKVTKSDLDGRPVYVWKSQHINAHFLTCFIALIFIKLIQKCLNWEYSASKIQECLLSASCQSLNAKIYLLTRQSLVFKILAEKMGLNFNFQYMKEEKIRKILKEFTKKKFSLTTK